MSKENLVSLSISEQTIADTLQAIEIIKTNFPGLLTLTPDERQVYAKMGDRSLPFVEKSVEYAKQNPKLVPNYVDVAELEKDLAATVALRKIYTALAPLFSGLDDTMLIAGSEAYTASLSFYRSVKDGAKHNVPGAKDIADDLGKRFPGHKRKEVNPGGSNI